MASSCYILNITHTPVLDEIIALSGGTEIPKIADVKASLARVRTTIRKMERKSDKDAWKDAINCFKETKDSGVSYDGPMIPPTSSPLPKEVEHEPEATKYKVQTTSLGSTAHVQPSVIQFPILELDVAPKPNLKPSIPYPSRLNDQKLREKANNQMLKFLQIFQRLHFDISFADAVLYMPKFASTFISLLSNKQKLFEMANTPLNENCSAVLLKKLPKKLRDLNKFLIPCDFPELEEYLALADLGASINLMHLSLWKKILLSELTPTRIHTLRYSYRYDDESVNRINVIDVTCDDYAQEVLGFLDSSKSGNPTPSSDPIIVTFSPSLTPFEGSDYFLEEIEACLIRDSIPPGIDDADFDPQRDILLLEKYFQIPIDPQDQEKTTFTCSYGTFAYRRMPFELCNASGTFQRCMMAILHDMIEEMMEVFMAGAENLTTDHLSRLENPHQGDLMKKEINETFPFETIRMISFHGNSCTLWFADIANYHAGNFVVKDDVFTAKKPLISSRLAIMDPPGDIMAKSRKRMKCLKMQFKYARSLTYGTSTLWDRSCLLEGKSIFSWPLTTCLNGLKRKRSPTNDVRVVVKFLKFIFSRFGTPRAIISDRGTHFCNNQFSKLMLKYRVSHHLCIAYRPQTSRQVDVSNHGLKHILERTVGENQASWSDKIDDALCAFCIAFKTPIVYTPYKLVYGKGLSSSYRA
nr:reverse transcriptase domain-containing protein [Tanacetum cinerariifolium]